MSQLTDLLELVSKGGVDVSNLSGFSGSEEKREYSPKVKLGGKLLKIQDSAENLVLGLGMSPDTYLTDEQWKEVLQKAQEIDEKVGDLLEYFATKGGTKELPDFIKRAKEEYQKRNQKEK